MFSDVFGREVRELIFSIGRSHTILDPSRSHPVAANFQSTSIVRPGRVEVWWAVHWVGRFDALYDVGRVKKFRIQMERVFSYVLMSCTCLHDSVLTRLVESMPSTFSTPMFWNEQEIEELEGTAVVGLSPSMRLLVTELSSDLLRRQDRQTGRREGLSRTCLARSTSTNLALLSDYYSLT